MREAEAREQREEELTLDACLQYKPWMRTSCVARMTSPSFTTSTNPTSCILSRRLSAHPYVLV